jgi:hypothetical protein
MKHEFASKRLDLATTTAASHAEEQNLQTKNLSVFTFFCQDLYFPYRNVYCIQGVSGGNFNIFWGDKKSVIVKKSTYEHFSDS